MYSMQVLCMIPYVQAHICALIHTYMLLDSQILFQLLESFAELKGHGLWPV